MMNFLNGIRYNLRGFTLALRNPKLLLLGISRLIVVISLMVALAGLILYHHATILNLLWPRPESGWFLWLWSLVSWLLSLVLMGFFGHSGIHDRSDPVQCPHHGHDVPA